jgi:hypothetical protein
MSPVSGLKWIDGCPAWAEEPNTAVIQCIVRRCLGIPPDSQCEAAFLIEGAHNKVYTVSTQGGTYIMRVALPLDPLKVASEVATMSFVRSQVSHVWSG